MGRHVLGEPLRDREVGLQCLQVAVVDADERRSKRQRARQFRLVMHFDKRVHAERACGRHDGSRPLVIENRQHRQHGVRSRRSRLLDLERVDDEILSEDRASEAGAGAREVFERSAEIGAVGQHTDRICHRPVGRDRRVQRVLGSVA
jgi:hypothetical protein